MTEDIKRSPILFAQVREDPRIEIDVLDKLNKESDVLLVGSGGCTLFTILNAKINEIDVIDINPAQIYLIELKLAVLTSLDLSQEQIFESFIGGENNLIYYEKVIGKLTEEARAFWDNHHDLILSGLNQCGIYEYLFNYLVDTNYDFDRTFDRELLIRLFGKEAVLNSSKSFADHFREVWKTYENNYETGENYFREIIINKNKLSKVSQLSYLQNRINLRLYHDRIHLHVDNFINYLKETDKKYDLIHTSNLTDWMNVDELHVLFSLLHRKLKSGGYVVMRRLIGDYELKKLTSQYFQVIESVPEERSCFYSEVVVGHKSN